MKDEPAFPTTCNVDGKLQSFNGLSRRDYFAACALQGILAANGNEIYNQATKHVAATMGIEEGTLLAKVALEAADCLIAELAKESK